MGMGRRKRQRQEELWIAADALPRIPRHVFYEKLNGLLAEAGFDDFVEQLCEPCYAKDGRHSIPPGVYFRMLFVGYFEGIDSQRGIAWRCADSLSLKAFLGYGLTEKTPDHSSLTNTRQRLPLEIHEAVFAFVLQMAESHRLLSNKTVAVDSTYLEANAAMKSIVRKETGEDWQSYIKRLMQEEGVVSEEEEPSDEEVRRFDRKRKGKKVSNKEWESTTDPESRIAKMKDGRTHLAYKAEHVVDLESEFLLDATVYRADEADTETLDTSLDRAEAHLESAGATGEIKKVVADKGYHANKTLAACSRRGTSGVKTYIPEPDSPWERRWTDKPPEYKAAVYNNRRRMSRAYGKALQRKRSELVERSFAHICETGGARRTWLRGIEKINKRYKLQAAARNLGLLMGKLFGIGKPRGMTGARGLVFLARSIVRRLDALRNRPSLPVIRLAALGNRSTPYPLAA